MYQQREGKEKRGWGGTRNTPRRIRLQATTRGEGLRTAPVYVWFCRELHLLSFYDYIQKL